MLPSHIDGRVSLSLYLDHAHERTHSIRDRRGGSGDARARDGCGRERFRRRRTGRQGGQSAGRRRTPATTPGYSPATGGPVGDSRPGPGASLRGRGPGRRPSPPATVRGVAATGSSPTRYASIERGRLDAGDRVVGEGILTRPRRPARIEEGAVGGSAPLPRAGSRRPWSVHRLAVVVLPVGFVRQRLDDADVLRQRREHHRAHRIPERGRGRPRPHRGGVSSSSGISSSAATASRSEGVATPRRTTLSYDRACRPHQRPELGGRGLGLSPRVFGGNRHALIHWPSRASRT